MLLLAAVILAMREDAARERAAAQHRAALASRTPMQIEGDRIRTALIRAQANAERAWRAATPPDEQRRQEADMMARFRSEEAATLMMHRLRELGGASVTSGATSPDRH